jgi:hypothetical protein
MKVEIKCPSEFIDRLDSAAQACGASRQRFMHKVLGAAVHAVLEREAYYRAFEDYIEARTMRARARL